MPTHQVQPPEWIDSAPIRVERTVEITAPPSVVWGFIADHVNWPKWFTTLDSVEVVGSPTGVGGGRRVTVKKLTMEEQFTAWDENEHFAFAVVASKVPILATMAESVRIVATDAGCRVIYRQGLQAKRGMGKALELMWKPAAKGLEEALANLKRLAEAAP
jgi:carbon monoxide dehydrogenase subunit G